MNFRDILENFSKKQKYEEVERCALLNKEGVEEGNVFIGVLQLLNTVKQVDQSLMKMSLVLIVFIP